MKHPQLLTPGVISAINSRVNKFLSTYPIFCKSYSPNWARKKKSAQSESAGPIEKQLETFLFIT